MTLGVGIIGSGSVTQGIHLPTLARLPDLFEVRNIMDVDEAAAARVAARVGAGWSTTLEGLLADDTVDVIAVCSPHRFHAAQVIAACRADKKGVLCEKPFAVSREEAQEIGRVVADTGVPVVVGAMHTFDPAWTAAREAWGDLPARARSIRSSIVLPFNLRFERFATEADAPGPTGSADLSTPEQRAAAMTARVLGLAIHDIPLVRTFLPDWRDARVVSAELLHPIGYALTLEAAGRTVELVGSMRDHWYDEWEFEVLAPDESLHVRFTPSYVHAGSGVATLSRGGERREFGEVPQNGYEREWRRLAQLAVDPAAPPVDVQSLVDDLSFAVQLADLAGDFIREQDA